MSRMLRKALVREEGFSSIEFLVVLAILAILVGIVVLTMQVSKSRARTSACKANLRTINGALSQYFAVKGKYPPDLQTLVDDHFMRPMDFTCPGGSGAYRYNSGAGEISCPNASHNS